MLRTWRDPRTEALFHRTPSPTLPAELQRTALRKLALLDSAIRLDDLKRLPLNHLETLAGGSHKGLHRIAIADGWYLRFRWMDGDAYKVEIVGAPEPEPPPGASGPHLPPIHPGEVLHDELMTPLGLTAAGLARELAVAPTWIRALEAGRRPLTAELALRLGRFFALSPAFWLNLQQHADLETARDALGARIDQEVRPFVSNLPGW